MLIVCRDCLKIADLDVVKLDLCIHRRIGRKWKATVAQEANVQAALATKQIVLILIADKVWAWFDWSDVWREITSHKLCQ